MARVVRLVCVCEKDDANPKYKHKSSYTLDMMDEFVM